MADKRKDLEEENLDLRILDLDALDDEFDFDPPKDDKPVKRFAVNFKRGFLQQTKSKVLLRNFLRSSLPDGYSRLWAAGESAFSSGKSTADDVFRETAPELDSIAQKMEEVLPNIEGRTPKRLYGRIEKGVGRFRRATQDQQDSGFSRRTQADDDNSELADALDALNETSRAEGEQASLEAEERRVRDKLDAGRFDVLTRQMDRIGTGVEHQVSYQDQIQYKFQRKSLELQYRSYFALRDLRKFAEVAQDTHETAYNALVHNSALPDHLKMTKSQRVRFGTQDSLVGALGTQMAASLPGFLASYYPTIMENIRKSAVQGIQAAGGMLSTTDMMSGMGGDSASTAGQVAGDVAGGFFRNTLVSRAAMMAKPGMERLGDKLGGGHHVVSYFLNNLPALLQEYTQDHSHSTGFRGVIQRMVRAIVPSYYQDDTLEDGSFQTIDRQAAFNQLTQRSIVEVIPGYLSRLLQETRMIRTGSDDVEREVWDVTTGQFTGYKAARKALQGRVINEAQRRNIDATLNQTVENFDPDGYLSDTARAVLKERMMREASRNDRFDPNTYASGEGYGEEVDDATLKELTSFFKAQFDFDDQGSMVEDAENRRRRNAFSDAFLEVRNTIPDPRAEIQRISGVGMQEILHDLGLMTSDYGRNRVNYDRVWDLYRGDGPSTPNRSGPRPEGPIPRTQIKTGYDENVTFKESVQRAKEAAKENLRFKRLKIELPKFDDALIKRLPELDGKTLAKVVEWRPELLDALKRIDGDIELRLAPHIEKLRQRGKPKKLDRETAEALWTLVSEKSRHEWDDVKAKAKKHYDQAEEATRDWRINTASDVHETVEKAKKTWEGVDKDPESWKEKAAKKTQEEKQRLKETWEKTRTATEEQTEQLKEQVREHTDPMVEQTRENANRWREEASRRSENIREQFAQRVRDPLHTPSDETTPGYGQTEYDQYVDGIQRIAERQAETSDNIFTLLREEMQRGFKVRELPELTFADQDGNATKAKGKAKPEKKWSSILKRGADGIAGYYKNLFPGIGKGMGGLVSGMGRGTGAVFSGMGRAVGRMIGGKEDEVLPDIYVKARPDTPVLLARDIKTGRYIDANTNTVIKSIDDITGGVWDTVEERIAITHTEFEEGLFTRGGEKIKTTRGPGILGTLGSFYNNAYLKPTLFAAKQLPNLGNVAKDMIFSERDAYIPGEKEPRIRANLLKKGIYFDQATGDPITRYKDISGTVVDANNNVVVNAAEIPHLVGYDGRPLETAGTKLGGVAKAIGGAYVGALKAGWHATKSVAKGAFDLGKAVSDRVIGMIRGKRGKRDEESMSREGQIISILGGIYDLLDQRLPQNQNFRKGSWQEELAKRAEEREEEKDFKEEQEWREEGIFGRIGRRLGGLLGMYQDRQDTLDEIAENTEDMDDGGTDILATGGGDGPDGRRRPGRTRRTPKKPAPKGFWRKAAHYGGKGFRSVGRGAASLGRGALNLMGMGGLANPIGRAAGGLGKGMAWAGKGLFGVGGMLVRGGAMAATGLVSMLGAPVVLAGTAVAGAAAGGFWLWNRHKKTAGKFRQLRLAQYGFPEDGGLQRRVVALENRLDEVTQRNEGSEPTLNLPEIDPLELIEIMGISEDDEPALLALGDWFANRMLPVYRKYQQVMMTHFPDTPLGELDDVVDHDTAGDILRMVSFSDGGSSPYQVRANPFDPETPLPDVTSIIEERKEAIRKEYDTPEAVRDASRATTAGAGSTAAIMTSVNHAVVQARERERRNRQAEQQGGRQVFGNVGATAALAVAGATNVTELASRRAAIPEYRRMTGSNLTALQAMRVRGYGLVDLNRSKVIALLTLEDTVVPYLTFSGDGTVAFEGSINDVFREVAPLFGLSLYGSSTGDETRTDKEKFRLWFRSRFLSVFLTYVSAIRQIDENVGIPNAERRLDDIGKLDVGKSLYSATWESRESGTMSVWEVPWLIFDQPAAFSAKELAKMELMVLEQAVSGETVGTAAQSAEQARQQAQGNVALSASAINSALQVANSGTSSLASRHLQASRTAVQRAQNRWGTAGVEPPRRPGGTAGALGNTFSGIVQGNGGQWEEVPMPRANKSKEAALPTLQAVEAMTGVDANLLMTFASIESAFDYTVKAPTSSATGWFQFIDATWDGMIEQHADKYGIPHTGMTKNAIREMRKDPRINALMGAEFLKGNYKYLERKLGRKPTDTDLYLAHFFGAGTAYKFLKADQNAVAANLFRSQANSNRNIFYRGGQPRTIAEVYQVMDEKVSGHRFGGTSASRTVDMDEPDPVSVPEGASMEAANDPEAGDAGIIEEGGREMIQLAPEGVNNHLQGVDNPMLTEGQRNAHRRRQSTSSRVGSTINPANAAVAGAGLGGPLGQNATPPTGGRFYGAIDSDPQDDPVVRQRERQRQQAEVADLQQRELADRDRETNRNVGRVLSRQLEVQQTMADYLKAIAENITGGARESTTTERQDDRQNRNDSSRPPEPRGGERRQHHVPPINMRRNSP